MVGRRPPRLIEQWKRPLSRSEILILVASVPGAILLIIRLASGT